MALFRKKADLISNRARVLNDEIAALEWEIKRLDSQLQESQHEQTLQDHPRLRSTALPHGTAPHRIPEPAAHPPLAASVHEPIFEDVDLNRLKARGETPSIPEHYNELGVRKYDLPALLHRIRNHFRGPSTTNPKLVNYLAAGGIQGLRPLRYEKRVARNRFIFFTAGLFLALLGIILALAKHH